MAVAAVIGALALQFFAKVINHRPHELVTDAPAGQCSKKINRASMRCEVNAARRANGRGPLTVNLRLRNAAQKHADAMATQHFFAHVDTAGRTPEARMKAAGYMRGARSWSVGENIAYGTGDEGTPHAIVRAWLKSPPHRKILLGDFREGGGGVARGLPVAGGSAGLTYVLNVGKRTIIARRGVRGG